jgi:hypothetical protein
MHANENRLLKYTNAAKAWSEIWKDIEKEIDGLSLIKAHKIIVERANGILPSSIELDADHV